MSIFESMIDDLFNVTEFVQTFTANGQSIKCINYSTNNVDPTYTQYGADDGQNFALTCKVADYTPAKGAKITYRSKQYKITTWTTDSFHLTYDLFLKDVSTK